MSAPSVFLSYASDHLEEVATLAEELRARGVRTWQDVSQIRSGEKVEAEIRMGLERADGCVWYVTERALESEWVRRLEVPLAIERRAPFKKIPVFRSFESFTNAGEASRAAFGVNLTEWNGYLADGSEECLARVARGVLSSFFFRDGDERSRDLINLGLHARSYSPQDEEVTLDWTSLLGSGPGDQETWSRIWRAVLDVRTALGEWTSCRRLHVSGKAHLTAGFAVGLAFPLTSGFSISVSQDREEWDGTSRARHDFKVDVDWGTVTGDVVTVEVGASRAIFADVRRHLVENDLVPRARLQIYPAAGPSRSSLEASQVGTLARDVTEHLNRVRAEVVPSRVLFFFACPLALAVLVGTQVNAAGASVECLEFDEGAYRPALSVKAGRAR